MIQSVIKRSGKIEPFIPAKLNKWSQWAAGNEVFWNQVVLDTIKNCTEKTIHSQDLQKKLIETCISFKTWPYQLMAGKLYAVWLRKKIYGDNIPTVWDLHQKLIELGLMKKLNYTKIEYSIIESEIIDHNRDFLYPYFQIDHIYKKYSIQNRITKEKFETPQFVFLRMAMALAEDEGDRKIAMVKKFYDHFSLGRLSAPTPNYINLGTPKNSYASCCLITADDTAKSLAIANHAAYTMTYMSAGIGINLNIRSINDPIKNGLIQHLGKVPYYRALAGAVKANMQSGRGGACTVYYSCYDPEAITIANLQNPRTPKDKQLRDLHFCVMFNKFFVEKVIKNEKIFVFNVYTAPDLVEAFYSDDYEKFKKLYLKYESDDNFKKTYYSARELFKIFARESLDTATHYFCFIDEVNRHTSFKEKIYNSNLCVAPETKILTERGWIEISKLENQLVKVWNGEKFTEVKVIKTNTKSELVKVTFTNGLYLECTPYHKFFVKNGDKIVKVSANGLLPGSEIIDFNLPIIDGEIDQLGKEIPIGNYSVKAKISWLNKFLRDHEKLITPNVFNNTVIIFTNKAFEIALLLQSLGCFTLIDHYQSKIVIPGSVLVKLKDLGLEFKYLELLENEFMERDFSKIHVDDIIFTGRVDSTYCFHEEDKNAGIFNGIITSQCLEITEPTKPYQNMEDLYKVDHHNGEIALCNLAAINICNIEDDETYADVAYCALKMIDKTIHMSHYELPHVGYTAKQRLNAGVGIIGLAYYLAKKNLKYSTLEGRNEIHKIAERHAYHLISQSLRLGKELGNAPWIDKTKWVDGWLPIDTYKKTVDELVTVGLQYDWESLRQEIIKNKGIRNSALIAFMPTESSSKATSVPNGIYPIRNHYLKKTDASNTIDWCAPESNELEYELAWDIDNLDLIKVYAIFQKFTDQAISADFYVNRSTNFVVSMEKLLEEFLYMAKYGIKTRYYYNSLTTKIEENCGDSCKL